MAIDGSVYLFYLAGADLIEVDDPGIVFFAHFFRYQELSPGAIQADDPVA